MPSLEKIKEHVDDLVSDIKKEGLSILREPYINYKTYLNGNRRLIIHTVFVEERQPFDSQIPLDELESTYANLEPIDFSKAVRVSDDNKAEVITDKDGHWSLKAERKMSYKFKVWDEGMTPKEDKDLAYWERNMLALEFADGWYNDDIEEMFSYPNEKFEVFERPSMVPRFGGWRRVLSLKGGAMCFHIPDDFEVGNLPQIERNWDGHTTEEKWQRVLERRGIV